MFVEMDHVAPDSWGRVSLANHLAQPHGSLDIDQALTWAIEFCHGMEHASQHGIRCHRDIKPSNILIAEDRTLARFIHEDAKDGSWGVEITSNMMAWG